MSVDIRIDGNFFDHPKTQKLIRRLGLEGLFALQTLWVWCAKNRPDGSLVGMDAEDIAIAARWKGSGEQGEAGLLETLISLRWIDETDDGYSLHDWREHNPWAADAENRADRARLLRLARANPAAYEEYRAAGRTGISKAEYQDSIAHVQVLAQGYAQALAQGAVQGEPAACTTCAEENSTARSTARTTARSTPAPAPASPPPPITPRPQPGADEPLTPAPAEQPPPPPAVPEGRNGAQPQGNLPSRQRQALGNLWSWARGDWLRTEIAGGMTKLYLDGARSSGKPSAEFITGTASNYEEALLKYQLTPDERDRVKAAFAGAMSNCRGWPQARELCDFLPKRDPNRQVGIPEETDRASPPYPLTAKFEEEKRQRYGKRTADAAGAEAAN